MTPSLHEEFRDIRDQLLALQQHAFDVKQLGEDEVALVPPPRRPAARNLIDYLALRQHDVARLQRALQRHGFSSLGVVQGHVMASIDALLAVLDALCGLQRPPLDPSRYPTIESARADLRTHADETLGPCPSGGNVRIMVTMPSEAASNPAVIDHLVSQGMTVMRVNCAHDGPPRGGSWSTTSAPREEATGKRCLIAMDLAGPKLRTARSAPAPSPPHQTGPRQSWTGTARSANRRAAARTEDDDGAPAVPLDDDAWAGSGGARSSVYGMPAEPAARSSSSRRPTSAWHGLLHDQSYVADDAAPRSEPGATTRATPPSNRDLPASRRRACSSTGVTALSSPATWTPRTTPSWGTPPHRGAHRPRCRPVLADTRAGATDLVRRRQVRGHRRRTGRAGYGPDPPRGPGRGLG